MDYSIKHSVRTFKIIGPGTIRIEFEDGFIRTIDFRNIMAGNLFGALRDLEYFSRVEISAGIPTLTWPNGADFNPDHLYHWPDFEALYIKKAKKWQNDSSVELA